MSLITSCPACGTMFRVVPDQLKISEGWVRCGHCGEVFDAAGHLTQGVPAASPAEPAPADAFAPAPIQAAAPQKSPPQEPPEPAPSFPSPASLMDAPVIAVRYAREDSAFAPSSTGPDSQPLEATELDAPFVFRRSDLLGSEPEPSVLPPATPPSPAEEEDDDEAEPPSEFEHVSFVRQARRKAFWSRPAVRLGLIALSVLLALLLLLQLAYRDRDRLALQQPALRPVLETLCAPPRCRLGAPRQIESLVIESSGFNRLRGDTYRLSFSVRNTAGVGVAAPAMELTLTDSLDQPLVRRVLTPAELGAREPLIAAGGEWASAVGIELAGDGSLRVAGYRLLAFYP